MADMRTLGRSLGLWVLLCLILIAGEAGAATCTSRRDGNWSSSNTWNCGSGSSNGPPASGDIAVIGNNVTLNASPTLSGLTVNGSLTGAGNYTLTLSGNLANNGTITLAGTTVVLGSDSVWSGSATNTFSLSALNVNWQNLTFTSGAAYTLQLSSSTPLFNVGSFNNDGANSSLTLYINGSGGQSFTTYGNAKYPNLRLGGGGTKTFSGSSIAILGSLTIDSGTTFDVSAVTGGGSLAGNLTINGSSSGLAAGGSGWTLNGTATQTITGAVGFYNLTVNNPQGIVLASGNLTVGNGSSGTLAFVAGIITTGSNLVILPTKCDQSGTLTGGGIGWVNGNLRMLFPNYGTTCTYPVGSATVYAPITVTFPWYNGITGGTLTGSTTTGQHPQIGTSGIDYTQDVNRYWTLGASGDTLTSVGSGGSYTAQFNFAASDVLGSGNVSTFQVGLYSSGWANLAGSASGTQATLPGQTGFGSFAVGPSGSCLPPLGSPSGMTCFCDSFDRSTGLGTDWTSYCVNGCSSTTFPGPSIVSNRLRLTDHLNNLSTAVTLQRYFPAAGNYISLEFNYFAWDTSSGQGADGIAFILSDSSITPQPGAFGGSLGYAQKTGISGFAGGWLGVGLDEYGNYANNSEGRVGYLSGCSGSTLCSNRISLRGSGSGSGTASSNYAFLRGSSTLSPNLDTRPTTTAGRGYRYQVVVDARTSGKALVSVNQDTTGTGGSYGSVISSFDALSSSTQAALPNKWLVSMTGSTGGSVNYHEVDNLKICATNMQSITNQIDHFEFIWDGSQCPPTGNIRVRACLDAACSSTYTGSLPVTFNSSSSSGWVGGATQTLASGDVTLGYNGAAGDTLAVISSNPSLKPYSAAICKTSSGATRPCSLSCSSRFNACHSDSTCSVASGHLYTRLAKQPFAVNISALTSADVVDTSFNNKTVSVSLVGTINGGGANDANNCPTGTVDLNQSIGSVTLSAGKGSIGSNSVGSSTIVVPNAYRDVRVKIVCDKNTCSPNGITSCSSDNFAVRPDNLDLAVPTGGGVLVAGDGSVNGAFAMTATATAAASSAKATMTNYNGTPAIDPSKVVANQSGPNVAGAIGGTFPTATSGVSQGTGFTYSEAGYFYLDTQAVFDGNFTAVDSGNSDCTADFSNTLVNTSDKVGCYFGTGTPSNNVGRFRPARFLVDSDGLAPACSAGTFTYMGQSFAAPAGNAPFFRLRAVNATGATTQNYDNSYANGKGVVNYLACNTVGGVCGADLGARLAPAPASAWALGLYTVNAAPTFSKLAAPDGPYDALSLGVWVNDGDGVLINPQTITTSGAPVRTGAALAGGNAQRVRYGRLKFANAYGSELLPLPVAATTEYWITISGGGYWRTNADDSCTTLTASAIPFANFTGNLNACETTACLRPAGQAACTAQQTATGGSFSLSLTAPGAGNIGTVLLGYNTAAAGGTACTNAAGVPGTNGNLPWLAPVQSGQAAFGAFRQRGVIYQREVY